jgi:hypothetical protein
MPAMDGVELVRQLTAIRPAPLETAYEGKGV